MARWTFRLSKFYEEKDLNFFKYNVSNKYSISMSYFNNFLGSIVVSIKCSEVALSSVIYELPSEISVSGSETCNSG